MNQKLPIFIKFLESKNLITVCAVSLGQIKGEVHILTIEYGGLELERIGVAAASAAWVYTENEGNYLDSISIDDLQKIYELDAYRVLNR